MFSAMRRLKSYLRATTGNERLNHLMTMHIHKERLDEVSMVKVAKSFVNKHAERIQLFGEFSVADLPKKPVEKENRSTQTE